MEAAVFLMGLAVLLAAPVALVVAVLAYKRAGRLEAEVYRLSAIERAQSAAEPTPAPPPETGRPETAAATAAPLAPPVAPVPAPARTRVPPPRPAAASRRRNLDLESILGGQWLTWTGILALFCGTAFFLGVDLGDHALAGVPQILIGLAVAAVFNLVGRFWSSRREQVLGLGLLGGGVALLYLAAYAAFGFHQLIPLWVVFPLLIVVAVVGAVLALDRNSLIIASLTLLGALLTPVLLQGDDPTYGLLPYLAVVNLGAVLVGLRRGWAGLPLAAFAATAVLILGWWDAHYRLDLRLFALICVTAIWLLYAIAPWLRRTTDRFWSLARAVLLAGNGLLFGLFCYHLLAPDHERWRGAALALLAVIYVGTARRMRRRKGESEATRLTYLTGVALALIAVPVQFDVAWITLGWIILAAILLVAGLRERDRWQRYAGLAVLGVVMLRALFLDVPLADTRIRNFQPVFNGEFLAGLALIGLLVWLFWAYRRWDDRLDALERRLRTPLLVTAVCVLAWKLSGELVGYFAWREQVTGDDQVIPGLLYIMLLWAGYGFATIIAGVRARHLPLRVVGALLLGAAVVITTGVTTLMGIRLTDDYRPVLNLPFLQGAALATLLGLTFWVATRRRDVLTPTEYGLRTPLLIAAILLLFGKVSLEVMSYFQLRGDIHAPNLEVKSLLTLSLVWALYAGAVVVAGFATRFKPLRILGICLVGLTVLKVFLMDIQTLDQGYRIAAFVALGVVLLAISLLYQRQRRSDAP